MFFGLVPARSQFPAVVSNLLLLLETEKAAAQNP
jgi:hypothetical protein